MRVKNIKRIVAVTAAGAMLGATLSAGVAAAAAAPSSINVPQLQIDKTKVVLPTIPEINGVPLHIKDDAATAVALVEKIYSDTIYSALDAFDTALVPVKADRQASNFVKDYDQIVTLESDASESLVPLGFIVYDDNGNPTGVDINGDGTAEYNLIKDDNGVWHVKITDTDSNGNTTTTDMPVILNNGLVLKTNIEPNGAGADVDVTNHFYVAQLDMPFANSIQELYGPLGETNKFYFGIDFSKINYIDPNASGLSALEKAHANSWEIQDGAIVLAYPIDYSPLKPSQDDKVVPSQVQLQNGDLINVLYYYKHLYPGSAPNTDVSIDIGQTLVVDGWSFKVIDIDKNQSVADVLLTAPNGQHKELFINIGSDYILFWIDSHQNLKYDVGSQQDMRNELGDLQKQGITTLGIVNIHDPFVGINNTQKIKVNEDVYNLKKTYKDGEKLADIVPQFANIKYANNWYLQIDESDPDHPVVEFIWKADYSGENKYPAVFLEPGDSLPIPVLYFKPETSGQHVNYVLTSRELDLTFNAQEDQNGNYEPLSANWFVYYYKNLDQYYKKSSVDSSYNLLENRIKSLDPTESIMTDQDLLVQGFQPGYDYIIVGGWVSNAAWSLLEQYYPDDVASMKSQLMNDLTQGQPGFVLKVLPNPADPNTEIIVAAGTDHEQTKEAVEALMAALS